MEIFECVQCHSHSQIAVVKLAEEVQGVMTCDGGEVEVEVIAGDVVAVVVEGALCPYIGCIGRPDYSDVEVGCS